MIARFVIACGVSISAIAASAAPSPVNAKPRELQPVLVLGVHDYVDHRQFADGTGQALQRQVVAWLSQRDLSVRLARANSLALGLEEARSAGCLAVLIPRWLELKIKRKRVDLAIALEWTGLQREPLARCEQRESGEVADEANPLLASLLGRAVDRCLAQIYTDSAATPPNRPVLLIHRELFAPNPTKDSAREVKPESLPELRERLPDSQFLLVDGFAEVAGRGIMQLDLYLADGEAYSAAVAVSIDEVEPSVRLLQRMADRAELELLQKLSQLELGTNVVDVSRIADSDPLDRWIKPIEVQLPQLDRSDDESSSQPPIWFWVEIDAAGHAVRVIPLVEPSEAATAAESALRQSTFTPGTIGGKPAPLSRLILISSPNG